MSNPNPDKSVFTNYLYDKRAWEPPHIFNQLLLRFAAYINGFQNNRTVILIISYNLTHVPFIQINSGSNIIIQFVPDSFTSNHAMLLNAMGVHSCMKILYGVSYLIEAMTNIALQCSNPFDINLNQEHRIIQRIWEDLSPSIITVTWKNSFIRNCSSTTGSYGF